MKRNTVGRRIGSVSVGLERVRGTQLTHFELWLLFSP